MKIKLKLFILLITVLVFDCKNRPLTTEVFVNKYWKYKLGDNMSWLKPKFNDRGWDSLSPGSNFEKEIFDNYNGFAWYRTKFFLPSSLISNAFLKDSLKIHLGAIDDCDQVYLNGYLIGENMKTMPMRSPSTSNFTSVSGLWDKEREYILSVADKRILWDKENIIAIRIFDQYGGGGIHSEAASIGMIDLKHYLKLDKENFYKVIDNRYVDKFITINNTSKTRDVSGELTVSATNTVNNTAVYTKRVKLSINHLDSQKFDFQLPVSTDPLAILFKIEDQQSDNEAIYSDSLPYVLTK